MLITIKNTYKKIDTHSVHIKLRTNNNKYQHKTLKEITQKIQIQKNHHKRDTLN